jgi:hypothetical protein
LAVAHFGRGRGAWQEGEQPRQWREVVEQVTEMESIAVDDLWKLGVEKQTMPDVLVRESNRLVKRMTLRVLETLYQA